MSSLPTTLDLCASSFSNLSVLSWPGNVFAFMFVIVYANFFFFFFRWLARFELPTYQAYKVKPAGALDWTFFKCSAFGWAHK